MRNLIGLIALTAVAVAAALFAGNNQATVTLFWPPYRVDMSLNLLLLCLVGVFMTVYVAMRALSAITSLPAEARRWRLQYLERSLQQGILDALSHLAAGRFIRARKAAEAVLEQDAALTQSEHPLPYSNRLRAMAHLLAAEGAHALQDGAARDAHGKQALGQAAGGSRADQEIREGLQLRSAGWLVDDRDFRAALQQLEDLPQGAARRTLALRLRFKVARQTQQTLVALETARLLGKHRAFSEAATQSLLQGLALEHLVRANDPAQMAQAWGQLHPSEQALPEVALTAAEQCLKSGGSAEQALSWLLPLWERLADSNPSLELPHRQRLIGAMSQCFIGDHPEPDRLWLSRIEAAQLQQPADPYLQLLYGVACWRFSLWGKAQQMLQQAAVKLQTPSLRRQAWSMLAQMAQDRQDHAAALDAWKKAALAEPSI